MRRGDSLQFRLNSTYELKVMMMVEEPITSYNNKIKFICHLTGEGETSGIDGRKFRVEANCSIPTVPFSYIVVRELIERMQVWRT